MQESGDATSDETLAAGIFAGEEDAARRLLERDLRPLFGLLVRLARDPADAEELFQETFLRALRASARFDRSRRFKPWLYAIAVNLARDHHQHLGHLARPRTTGDGELPEPAGGGGVGGLEELRQDLRRALGRLPSRDRETVVLRYYEGLDEAEMAAVLAIPRGTVKSRLHHAVRRLRELMREGEG